MKGFVLKYGNEYISLMKVKVNYNWLTAIMKKLINK